MAWTPVPVVGGSYADATKPFSSQDTVNCIPEKAGADNARSASIQRDLPGLAPFSLLPTGPVRGAHNCEGKLFVVAGHVLYQVALDGLPTVIGTVPGTGRVGMQHNQIAGGNELVIGNGGAGYVYNTVSGVFGPITDTGFPGTLIFVYVDTYLAGVEPLGRYWFHSDIAAATSYSELDRYEAEAAPDLIQSLIINHREVWVLGQRTIEPFDNTGAAQGTFQRANGIVIEQGVASPFAAVNIDNTVLLFGNDGIFYRMEGYTPIRISTHAIEQAVRGKDWSQCFAMAWTDGGHKVVYWTFPDGNTWGYDVATGLWHRRETYGKRRWNINALVYWNGVWVSGDAETGLLCKLDWDYPIEAGLPLRRLRTTGVMHANGNRVVVNAVALEFDTGSPVSTVNPIQNSASPPVITPPAATPALAIIGTPPTGQVGVAYSFTFTATGGSGLGYMWSIASGSLPSGTSLDPVTGTVSGTPTTKQLASFTLRVTDSFGKTTTAAESIRILNEFYLVVGASGSIATSPDAITWTVATSGTSEPLNCVVYGNGVYVTVGGSVGGPTTILSSTDAAAWTSRTAPFSNRELTGVAYGAGLFVAVSNPGGFTDGEIISSPDGVTWTSRTSPAGIGPLRAITFANGKFIAVSSTGYSTTSADGITWGARVAVGTQELAIAYSATDNQFMAVGSGAETYISVTGASWAYESAQGGVNYSFLGLTYAASLYIAGSNGGSTYVGIYTSTDGIAWTRRQQTAAPCNAVANTGSLLIAGDSNQVWTSTDGLAWTARTVGTSQAINSIFAGLVQ